MSEDLGLPSGPRKLSSDSGVNLTPVKEKQISDNVSSDKSGTDIDFDEIDVKDELIEVDTVGEVDAPNKPFSIKDVLNKTPTVSDAYLIGNEHRINSDNVVVIDDDDDSTFMSEKTFEDTVDLSSDEEPEDTNDQDIVLELLKRPYIRHPSGQENSAGVNDGVIPIVGDPGGGGGGTECLDILDSDEEFPVCLAESSKNDHVNIEEKNGFVKEYIETEGSGVIFSQTYGLVLFHLSTVWVEGKQLSLSRTRQMLPIGAAISFYDQSVQGPEFEVVSKEGVLHQAIVVWTGERPKHLMKKIDDMGEEYMRNMEAHRKAFVLYLRGEVFLRVDLVRVKGTIQGFVTQTMGIVEVNDENEKPCLAVFHIDDVRIFRKPTHAWRNVHPSTMLPVGLKVSVDARRLVRVGLGGVTHQAVVLLAGSWPSTPHPTLLPGGQGSHSPSFQLEEAAEGEQSTFYYLELALEAKLTRKVGMLREVLERSQGELRYNWRAVEQIRSKEDLEGWRGQFVKPRGDQPRRQHNTEWRRPVQHAFKAPLPRKIKTKEELDLCSDAASVGGSHRSGWSDVEAMSLPPMSPASNVSSRVSHTSSLTQPLSPQSPRVSGWGGGRSWYGVGPGCLQIKSEVKQEGGEEGPSFPAKRVKLDY